MDIYKVDGAGSRPLGVCNPLTNAAPAGLSLPFLCCNCAVFVLQI